MISQAPRFAFLLVLLASLAKAQDYVGRFSTFAETRGAVLTFSADSEGSYTGALSNAGFEVTLNGAAVDGVLRGSVDDGSGSVVFVAELQDPLLMLTLFEVDEFEQPIPGSAQMLLFERVDGVQEPAASDAEAGDVVINGLVLSHEQRSLLEATYGVAASPGNYWYDPLSGLYGVVGYQAFGFMYPGHEFGILKRAVSHGDTGVLVNGRELPQSEWLIWSSMLGYAIQAGSYWLDGQGNAGYEGNPIPIVNLYVAAQQNAYAGQSGSGENFWSSRFGAGNYDAGGARGYVSVPGHGPVGYGF